MAQAARSLADAPDPGRTAGAGAPGPAEAAAAAAAASEAAERPLWPAIRAGLLRRCPACGEGHLFDGYLKVAERCPACGTDLTPQRADDGPAYLTILIVGHLLAPAIHLGWTWFRPEPLVFATVLTVAAVALSLFLLPRLKGAVVAVQWSRRMGGFGRP